MVEKEEFRDIKGYEGHYQVSNFGRVKSLKKYGGKNSRILKSADSKGFRQVVLWLNRKSPSRKVHQLVAVAFLGHQVDGHNRVINHIDGDKANNHVSNLEIVTHRENVSTCFRKNEGTFSSKYIGVSWNKFAKKWESYITIKKQRFYLGLFINEKEASNAYQKALKEHLQNNQTKK